MPLYAFTLFSEWRRGGVAHTVQCLLDFSCGMLPRQTCQAGVRALCLKKNIPSLQIFLLGEHFTCKYTRNHSTFIVLKKCVW